MQKFVFCAVSPYEIGDKITVSPVVAGSAESLYIKREAEITDIASINYTKSGRTEFIYELDNSGDYQRLATK